MIQDNPYASPNSSLDEPSAETPYKSCKQAIFTGLIRGVKFGGKWMSIPLILLAATVWIILLALFLFQWIEKGDDFRYLLRKFDLLKGLWLTTIFIVFPTLIGASFGALIMGVGEGITYRKSLKKNEKITQSDFPMEPANED